MMHGQKNIKLWLHIIKEHETFSCVVVTGIALIVTKTWMRMKILWTDER
jgi:hypothetical protein